MSECFCNGCYSDDEVQELIDKLEKLLDERKKPAILSRPLHRQIELPNLSSSKELMERYGEDGRKLLPEASSVGFIERVLSIYQPTLKEKPVTNYITSIPLLKKYDGRLQIIPSFTEESAECFADPDKLSYSTVANGRNILTGPIRTGRKVDLYCLAEANVLINNGLMDVSSTIDPDAKINYIYLNVLGSVMKFDVSGVEQAKAVPTLLGDSRGVNFAFGTDRILLTENSLDVNGASPPWTRQLAIAKCDVNLVCQLDGTISTAKGNMQFNEGYVSIFEVVSENENNQLVALLVSSFFENIKFEGFDLEAYFTNPKR